MGTSGDVLLVKDNLGHARVDTTDIYVRSLPAKLKKAMDDMSDQLWSEVVT